MSVPHHPKDLRPRALGRLFQFGVHSLQPAQGRDVHQGVAVKDHDEDDASRPIDAPRDRFGARDGDVELAEIAHGPEELSPGQRPDKGGDQEREHKGGPQQRPAREIGPRNDPGGQGSEERGPHHGSEADFEGMAKGEQVAGLPEDRQVVGERNPVVLNETLDDHGAHGVDDKDPQEEDGTAKDQRREGDPP